MNSQNIIINRAKRHSKVIYNFFAIILSLVMVLACFSGCKETDDNSKAHLTKIADYLYEITYTEDFNWEKAVNTNFSSFACSGVQNGKYRGRNYDWVYAYTDMCVIHATTSKNRPHASVGVIDLNLYDENFTKQYDVEKIPFATVDGINDAGVCIQVNVLPYGENGQLNHTESEEDDIYSICVARYILDYAGSIEEAIEIFNTKDIYSELEDINEVHWMISGPTSSTDKTSKTVVVEIFPDGVHVTDSFVDDKPIMTNFNISNFDGSIESVGFGTGYERWKILNEKFNQANSVIGTFDLMEKVFYSKYYDLYSDNFWYSDYFGVDLGLLYSESQLETLLGENLYNYYIENYGAVYFNAELCDGEQSLNGDIEKAGIIKPAVQYNAQWYEAQDQEDESIWITLHTAVYDIEQLTLDIQVHESQDHLHFTI